MASSSVSVLVFEKQELRCQLQESPQSARGCDPRGSIERFVLTLAGSNIKLPLDGKVNGDRSQLDHNSDSCHEIATIAG